MSALRDDTLQIEFVVVRILCFTALFVFLARAPEVFGQEQSGGSVQAASPSARTFAFCGNRLRSRIC